MTNGNENLAALWEGRKTGDGRFVRDWAKLRKHADKYVKSLFEKFAHRRDELTNAARHFYPLGVQGLVRGAEDMRSWEDDKESVIHFTPKPVEALRKGAAGFHSNLTSPSTKWFELKLVGRDGSEEDVMSYERKAALDRLTALTADVMRNASLYPAIQKIYTHCLCFGFACMVISEDADRVVKATTLRVGTYALGVDGDGQVNRVARKFAWTAEEIVRQFGRGNVPEKILNAYGRPDAHFRVVNLIEPNDPDDPLTAEAALGPDMVYRSIYYVEGCGSNDDRNCGVLEIRGFKIKPIVAPRYDTEIGDVYGSSPARLALATARKVQSCEEDRMRIAANNAMPALLAPSSMKGQIRVGRGQVTYSQDGEQAAKTVRPIFPQGIDATGIREQEEEGLQDIGDIFFNGVFATIDMLKNQKGVKSATEINALVRENMEALGAVVSNFDRELLDPLVEIVAFYTYHRFVEPVDGDVLDMIKINYVSKIHLAQKQAELAAIETHLQFAGAIGQLQLLERQGSQVVGNIDFDHVMRKHAMLVGLDAECLKPVDEVEADRAAEQAAQQQAAQMARAAQIAQLAGEAGAIPTDENHAGGQILKALQGENA